MKKKSRLLAILLALAMVLTYMPALAFADDDDDGDDPFAEVPMYDLELVNEDAGNRLYSDGEIQYRCQYDEEIPDGAGLEVGLHIEDGDWQSVPEKNFVNDEGSKTVTITLSGSDVKAMGASDGDWMDLSLSCVSGETTVHWAAFTNFGFREAKDPQYEFERDRDMLPGWGGDIGGSGWVWLDDAAHPETDTRYEVNNVTVTSGEDLLEDGVQFYEEGEDRWWEYRIKDVWTLDGTRGTVTFKVDYTDVDNKDQSYSFKVTVTDEVCNVDVWPEDGSNMTLPGGIIGLVAEADREFLNEDGDYDSERIEDADAFEWTVDDGAGVVKSQKIDGTSATLTFKTLQELGKDDIWGDVDVEVSLKGKNAASSIDLHVSSNYEEINPLIIDLKPGQTTTEKFEVKRYSVENGEETINNAEFEFNYDTKDFSITPVGTDNTYQVKRLTRDDAGFNVRATWTETYEGGDTEERNIERDYNFGWEDYSFWADEHDIDVFTDAESAAGVFCLDDLDENWGDYLEFEVTAGRWDDEGDEGKWTATLGEDDYDAYFDEKGNLVVSLDKDFLAEEEALIKAKSEDEQYDDIRVQANLYVKGAEHDQDNSLSESDFWFHFRAPECNYYDLQDADILAIWSGWVYDKESYAWVRNSQYPDGEEVKYQITNVEIVSQDPVEEGGTVFELEEEENDWFLHRVGLGSAVVSVSFIDVNGQAQTKEVTLRVVKDIYYVNVKSADGRTRGLPGDKIELVAEGLHQYVDENGDYAETTEGLKYKWEGAWGDEDLYDLTQDAKDPSKATVTLKAPQNSNEFCEDFGIRAVLYSGSVSDENRQCDSDIGLSVSDEYSQIEPMEADDLDIGDSQTMNFSTVFHKIGQNAKPVEDIQYRLFIDGEDSGNLEIKDSKGKVLSDGDVLEGTKITVTRTGSDSTWFTVRAETAGWDGEDEQNGHIFDLCDYHYEYKSYWTWIDSSEEDLSVSAFGDKTFQMQVDDDLAKLIRNDAGNLTFETEAVTADRNLGENYTKEDIVAIDGAVKSAGLKDGKFVVVVDGTKIPEKMTSPNGEFDVESICINVTVKRKGKDGKTYILSKDEGLGRPVFVDRTSEGAQKAAAEAEEEAVKAAKNASDALEAAKKATVGSSAALEEANKAKAAANTSLEQAKKAKSAADAALKAVKAEGYAEDSDEYKAAAAAADAAQKSLDAAKKAVSAADSQVKEAERQGVLSTSLPKIKISKPAAGKKSVTVKWKKLSTKNKKKADKIEVWVCPNKSFKASDTIMKTASKSKASLKIKKLKSKKKYYVKTRTIKYVNGVKTVSKWSTPKKFKVK